MRVWCAALIALAAASASVAVAPARAQDACGSLVNERDIDRCLDRLTRDAGLSDEPVRRKPAAKPQAKPQQTQPQAKAPVQAPAKTQAKAPATPPKTQSRATAAPRETPPAQPAKTAPTPADAPSPPPPAKPASAAIEPAAPAPVAAQPVEERKLHLGPGVSPPPAAEPSRSPGMPWAIILSVIAAAVIAGLVAWTLWRDHRRKAASVASPSAPHADATAPPSAEPDPVDPPPPPAPVEPSMASFETAAPSIDEPEAEPIAAPAPAPVVDVSPPLSAVPAEAGTSGDETVPDPLDGLKTWLDASGFEARDWRDLVISSARRVGARGYQALGEEERLVAALLDEAQTAQNELFVAARDKADLQEAISHALGDQARLIWPQPGEPFDPRRHQSYPEPPAGAQIASVQRAGFTSNGQIFRAYVEVAPAAD